MAQNSLSNLFTIDAQGAYHPADAKTIVANARQCLDRRLARTNLFANPSAVKDYLSLKMGAYEREVFSVIFLDAQNAVIEYREMFQGTLTQTSVYSREVVKLSLELNAAAVILAHNHPSGAAEPSRADEYLPQTLKSAMAMVDVRVLNRMVVGGGRVTSFAERGLL